VPELEAAQRREAPATEPDYPLGEPARPLPASAYGGYVPQPPSAAPPDRAALPLKTAAMGAAATPLHAPEPAFADLDPPAGAPAWYYDGAAVEPPHDLPAVQGTPLPLAAAGYARADVQTGALQAEAASVAPEDPAVLQTKLPPLPLQPAKSAPILPPMTPPPADTAPAAGTRPLATEVPPGGAAAPVAPPAVTAASVAPTPAQLATIAAAAAAAAASASSAAAAHVLTPRPVSESTPPNATSTAALPPAGQKAASAKPAGDPEDLLKAATERAQQAAKPPAAPPPLPFAPPPPLPGTLAPESAASQNPRQRPPVQPAPLRAESTREPAIVRGAAPEARVTIRRTEDGAAAPVIRNPGGTPVHLSRQEGGRFDGEGYAAYHSEVEEAAVQIVKKTPPGVPATRRAVPPLPSSPPVQADPAAGARAAAEAAARAAAALNARSAIPGSSQAPATPPVPPPVPAPAPAAVPATEADAASGDPSQLMKKGAEKAAVTMGRFLKALTGQ
jgi:hypothetical protein